MVVHEGVKITTTCGTCGMTFDSQTKLQNHKVCLFLKDLSH